ncbi:MAG: tyrosine-type recombinase/integrase [Clostridia bacterium]|nr:tyrosine-type recombinase/integrase [Clostridia bacterium]
MRVIIDEFISHLESKHAAKNTIASYERDIVRFEDYFESKNRQVYSLKKEDMQEYIDYLKSQNKSTATISRTSASIKAFFKYLVSRNLAEENIVVDVEMNKVEKKDPVILTKAEIEALLNQPIPNDLKGKRDETMLNVLYSTGMRVTELISLKVSDVNITTGTVRVVKNKTARIIKLNNSTMKILTNYIDNLRPLLSKPETDDTLFLNANGKKLTRQGFWKILKQYKEGAHIDKELTPHTLRHSFAVHQLQDGMDIKKLQEVLGHTDIATTMMYNNYIDEHRQV